MDEQGQRLAVAAHLAARNTSLHSVVFVIDLSAPLPVTVQVGGIEESSGPICIGSEVPGCSVASQDQEATLFIECKAVCVLLLGATRVKWEEVRCACSIRICCNRERKAHEGQQSRQRRDYLSRHFIFNIRMNIQTFEQEIYHLRS